jgi:LDH2 family malate/lactate/ureidoglycolate dehydrogenase
MPRFKAERLATFTTAALASYGVPEEDARVVAESLVDAELEGQSVHGLQRLPSIVGGLRDGHLDPQPVLRVAGQRQAVVLLDAGNALGQVAGVRAVDLAIDRARLAGVGLVAVRRSNHLGVPSFYLRRFAARGMVGLVFSNAPPAIAPPGSDTPYLGTNPIAATFPTSHHPVLIDMAISQLGGGHILEKRRLAAAVPEGWAVGAEGQPAGLAFGGATQGMGNEKAFALALLVEVLAGVLSDAAIGPEVGRISSSGKSESNVGHCFIAIDPGAATGGFVARMDELVDDLRGLSGRVPGDRRHAQRERRLAEGVVIDADLVATLAEAVGRSI